MRNRKALDPGDPFPRLTATSTSGDSVTIPDDYRDAALVLVFYRGHW